MKYNEIHHMTQKPEPKPDTYEAGMAQNQLLKIGTHAIKIHNMIDDRAEMEAWVAKKIDLASNYVKSVHGYTAGQKAGTYDDNGMTESREQIGDYAREIKSGKIVRIVDYTDDDEGIYTISYGEDKGENDVTAKDLKFLDQTGGDQEEIGKFGEDADIDANFQSDVLNFLNNKVTQIEQQIESKPALTAEEKENKEFALKLFNFVQKKLEQKDDNTPLEVPKSMIKKEDAGEGHMSKSQLYQTAKMSIELLDMIRKGDDLEGWVQTKLNLAADYLQAVYHYEDYQKLSPYREELDSALVQRHAGVIQKHLDEILSKETETADVDTKPGMMRILKKRVNEVEKEIAKENRKNTDEGDGRKAGMHPKGHPMRQKQQAAIHANEADLEEGIKDWAQKLAAAGVIVGAVAGMSSINNAIDNSVPAVKALNTAYELAVDQGHTELAKDIKNDLSAVKIRLQSGKDLNFVADIQNKYSKFVDAGGLPYESKLALQLNQQLK